MSWHTNITRSHTIKVNFPTLLLYCKLVFCHLETVILSLHCFFTYLRPLYVVVVSCVSVILPSPTLSGFNFPAPGCPLISVRCLITSESQQSLPPQSVVQGSVSANFSQVIFVPIRYIYKTALQQSYASKHSPCCADFSPAKKL